MAALNESIATNPFSTMSAQLAEIVQLSDPQDDASRRTVVIAIAILLLFSAAVATQWKRVRTSGRSQLYLFSTTTDGFVVTNTAISCVLACGLFLLRKCAWSAPIGLY